MPCYIKVQFKRKYKYNAAKVQTSPWTLSVLVQAGSKVETASGVFASAILTFWHFENINFPPISVVPPNININIRGIYWPSKTCPRPECDNFNYIAKRDTNECTSN